MELESLGLKGRYNWVSSAYKWKDTPYFKKMEPYSSRYKENNVGERIDPCGTPHERCAAEEVCFPMCTENFLLFKKDWNHFRTVSCMPTRFYSQEIRIVWSTISKAELRSKRTRATALPLSVASIMSLVTFNKADSVLWSFLNPDWNISYSELNSRKECSWVNTTLSKNFEMKGRLEIGLKLPKSDTSRFCFFKRWVTEACFRQSGTVLLLKHVNKKQEIRPYGINNLLIKVWWILS